MVGGLSELECPSIIVNGVEDHVHLLVRLSRNMSVAKLVQEIKVSSSKWLKDQSTALGAFQWQRGYSAFSVSRSQVERVRLYIADQERHHRRISFQDEVRSHLLKHQIEYDENYVWD